jgi:anti-sigma factor RsiW
MNMHAISDNDLILYYYKDGLDARRIGQIDAALREAPALRRRYEELQRMLGSVDAGAVAVPDAAFEQRIWQRLEPRLGAPRHPVSSVSGWRERLGAWLHALLSPQFALAATALLALAVGIGYYAGRHSATTQVARDNALAARVLDAYVADHLRAT